MHKRFIILFLAMTAFLLQSYGQGYRADVLLGANFSQIDGDQFAGYNKLGLNAGIAISRAVKPQWDASFEILYSMKGSRKVVDPDVVDPTLTISYHYLEVPLMARYHLNEKVSFYGGPSIGINVFNERNDNGFVSQEQQLNRTEFALHLGGSYHFSERIALEFRHSYSLLSIRDQGIIVLGPTWFGRAGWYNRLFTAGLRVKLGS